MTHARVVGRNWLIECLVLWLLLTILPARVDATSLRAPATAAIVVAASRGIGNDSILNKGGAEKKRDGDGEYGDGDWWLELCDKLPLGLKNGVASGLAAAVCKCKYSALV